MLHLETCLPSFITCASRGSPSARATSVKETRTSRQNESVRPSLSVNDASLPSLGLRAGQSRVSPLSSSQIAQVAHRLLLFVSLLGFANHAEVLGFRVSNSDKDSDARRDRRIDTSICRSRLTPANAAVTLSLLSDRAGHARPLCRSSRDDAHFVCANTPRREGSDGARGASIRPYFTVQR